MNGNNVRGVADHTLEQLFEANVTATAPAPSPFTLKTEERASPRDPGRHCIPHQRRTVASATVPTIPSRKVPHDPIELMYRDVRIDKFSADARH
jgi:hypothetical protein